MFAANESIFGSPTQFSRDNTHKHRPKSVKFVICNSCFWCSSLLDRAHYTTFISKCPCCKSEMIESMPVEPGEEYSFQKNEVSGVILEFRSLSKGVRGAVEP